MDIANMENALVIGTGDLSELALGWATYNGDHMSMYAVNASVPKTLVRYITQYEAHKSAAPLKKVLLDILDTPVSPELLPPQDGVISQKTEELVGPYDLHDFSSIIICVSALRPQKFTVWQRRLLRGNSNRRKLKNGSLYFSGAFSASSSSVPVCLTARRSALLRFLPAGICACRAMRMFPRGLGSLKKAWGKSGWTFSIAWFIINKIILFTSIRRCFIWMNYSSC